ncbi:MAG: hypothetical protein C4325_00145 [Blastocatellia bacterium]
MTYRVIFVPRCKPLRVTSIQIGKLARLLGYETNAVGACVFEPFYHAASARQIKLAAKGCIFGLHPSAGGKLLAERHAPKFSLLEDFYEFQRCDCSRDSGSL